MVSLSIVRSAANRITDTYPICRYQTISLHARILVFSSRTVSLPYSKKWIRADWQLRTSIFKEVQRQSETLSAISVSIYPIHLNLIIEEEYQ